MAGVVNNITPRRTEPLHWHCLFGYWWIVYPHWFNIHVGLLYQTKVCVGLGMFIVSMVMILSSDICFQTRKLGDPTYLSWNKPGGGLPTNKRRQKLEKGE